jgi:hypothetical protein
MSIIHHRDFVLPAYLQDSQQTVIDIHPDLGLKNYVRHVRSHCFDTNYLQLKMTTYFQIRYG